MDATLVIVRAALRLVIVDDHDGFRQQARRLLERHGFTVAGEASDGRGAIEMIGAVHPDAVLLDVQLPDMTGFDVVAGLPLEARPPVVLISGRPATDYGERVHTSGACAFLQKDDLTAAGLRDALGSAFPSQDDR